MPDLKIQVIGSTKQNFILSKKESLKFGSYEAGVCYLKDNFGDITSEPPEKTLKRQRLTLKSGHHSVYGHSTYNLLIINIPKILAIFLNNEKVYTTSEKSARYTKMDLSPIEKELYNKWLNIFDKRIEKVYPKIKPNKRKRLSMENARYLTSVFTPTIMGYSTNFRQLNYIMHWFKEFIENEENTTFNNRLKNSMDEFNKQLNFLYVEELNPQVKFRKLSLITKRKNFNEFFDEAYSTNYKGSFAQLAQAQRHRTINYKIQEVNEPKEFFVPPIIKGTNLSDKWTKDISSIAEIFPQGSLVQINERGLYEDFVSKCGERLCGDAQLEISLQTYETLKKYLAATKNSNKKVYEELSVFSNGPKCTIPGFRCRSPCIFGRRSLERLI